MWDLPRPGIKPMPPALAGRFFATEPPGRPPVGIFGRRIFEEPNNREIPDQETISPDLVWLDDLTIAFASSLNFSGGSGRKKSICNAGDSVQSLGWDDPLEKRMATHSSLLVWRIPWTEEPGRLWDLKRGQHDWVTKHECTPWSSYLKSDPFLTSVSIPQCYQRNLSVTWIWL